MKHNSLVLAFIGDSVFELKIREHLINTDLVKVNDLQKASSKYASATGHYNIVQFLLENDLLTQEELTVYKRGRNTKVNTRRKNFNSRNYHASTGFEALIGYLYLDDQQERVDEIISLILERFE